LCWTFFLIAIASILMVIMPPHLGIESSGSHLGSWRGAYIQKNYLGRYMTLGCLCFYFLEGETPLIRWGGFGLCGLLVVLSQSKSAWAFLLILLCLIPLFWFLRLSLSRLVPTFVGLGMLVTAILYVILININALLGLLGRDLTFSGRTTLWAMLWQKFLQHKWLGYGFGGFWPVEYISIWTQTVSWFPLHAHSGYFDLLLALGFVGMAIFVYLFIRTIWQSVAYLRHGNTRESLWPLTLLGFVFLYNLSEVTLLHESSLFWIVLTAVACVVAMARQQQQQPATAARPLTNGLRWNASASYPQPGVVTGLSARKAY
jgi:O-antigen ligase